MSAPEAPHQLPLSTQAVLVLVLATVYFYAYKLNLYWFSWFEFSHGTNWVHIPSGLRLLFVLVLLRLGSMSIVISSLAVNYGLSEPNSHFFNIGTALLSGTSPFLARFLSIKYLKLDTQLSKLNASMLLNISIVFAVVNAVTHQLWFFWNDQTHDFMASAVAMGVGDWFGTVLVLAATSLCVYVYRLCAPSDTSPRE